MNFHSREFFFFFKDEAQKQTKESDYTSVRYEFQKHMHRVWDFSFLQFHRVVIEQG